ncbi:helix-turn-helix domain-containing protein [Rhodobacter capsulatus]|uniref:helix-turn-helix domain-containing protein n=1 Tax=Rhodobacter capsulatus TaxID=1061 RepID=UPI0040387B9A
MAKAFMGVRLKRLREDRGITQASLARALEISPSYLNQIENNQRPLTVPVLLKLNAAFGLDVQLFSDADEARLIAELRGALADQGAGASLAEVREIAANMPAVARAIVAMQARLRDLSDRADALAGQISTPASSTPAAFEAVRDWFYERRNHVPDLDTAAEAVGADLPAGRMAQPLAERLATRHGIRILHAEGGTLRRFEPGAGLLHLGAHLTPGQQAFQIATQLALLEQGGG